MKRTYMLIVSLLIIVLFVAGFDYFTKHWPILNHSHKATGVQKSTTNKVATLEGTLKSLLLANKAQKCTYYTSTASTIITGNVYVANRKMKGDFSTGSQGIHINGHLIINDKNAYIWTDLSKQGFKFYLGDLTASTSAQNNNSQAPNLNQKINYSCNNWSVDKSVFIPPTDITFSNLAIPTRVTSGMQ